MGAGSSGVDLNAIPSSALDRIEVLRDGAVGPVRLGRHRRRGEPGAQGRRVHAVRERRRRAAMSTDDYAGRRHHRQRERRMGHSDRRAASLGLFGEFRDRQPTNRAWADRVRGRGHRAHRRRSTTTARWSRRTIRWTSRTTTGATALEKDVLTFANFRLPVNEAGTTEIYAFGGYSHRDGTGNALPALLRQRAQLAGDLPARLPARRSAARRPTIRAAGGLRGVVSGWNYDLGATFGHNDFDYNMTTTNNASLGPCLDVAVRTGRRRDPRHGRRSGHPEPDRSSSPGRLLREEFDRRGQRRPSRSASGCPNPVNLAFGAAFRRERYAIRAGEPASWVNGVPPGPGQRDGLAPGRARRSFPGFTPGRRDRPGPDQLRALRRRARPSSRPRCWRTWPRGSRTTATSASA